MTALQGMYYLISCCILGLNLIRLWTKLGLWFDYVNDRICTRYTVISYCKFSESNLWWIFDQKLTTSIKRQGKNSTDIEHGELTPVWRCHIIKRLECKGSSTLVLHAHIDLFLPRKMVMMKWKITCTESECTEY